MKLPGRRLVATLLVVTLIGGCTANGDPPETTGDPATTGSSTAIPSRAPAAEPMLYPIFAHDDPNEYYRAPYKVQILSGFLDKDFNPLIEGTYSDFYFGGGCLRALNADTGLEEIRDLTGEFIVALPVRGSGDCVKDNQYFISYSGGGSATNTILYGRGGNELYRGRVEHIVADMFQVNYESLFDAAARREIHLEFEPRGPDGSYRSVGTFQYYSGYDGWLAPLISNDYENTLSQVILYFTLSGTTIPPDATYSIVGERKTSPFPNQKRESLYIGYSVSILVDKIDGVQIRPDGLYTIDGELILSAQIDVAKNRRLLQHYWVRIGSVEGYVDKNGTWLYRQPAYGWLND